MIWRDQTSTAVFYKFIASLRKSIHEDVRKTSATHRFIRTLRDQRKLVRCYTQNIDGLEEREGLCTDMSLGRGHKSRFTKKLQEGSSGSGIQNVLDRGCEVVQLHGDLQSLRCTLCQQTCSWNSAAHTPQFLLGRAPRCSSCALRSDSRRDRGKRGTKVGTLRPNIVLYGEEHPSAEAVNAITTYDLTSSPDLLLVLGTSLHVHGLKMLVREFAKSVHARPGGRGKVVFINLSRPAESVWKDVFDYWVNMDCDRWVGAMKKRRPDIWKMQAQLSPPVTKKVKMSNVEETDKENIEPDSQDSLISSPPRPKVVVHTPKKQKSPPKDPRTIVGVPYGSPTYAKRVIPTPKNQKLPLKNAGGIVGVPYSSPRYAKRVIPDSDPQSSLPSPPPSGCGSPGGSRKRERFTDKIGEEVPETPSKKRRAVQIWED